MTEYLGAARTNYVRVSDLEGLKKMAAANNLDVVPDGEGTSETPLKYALVSLSEAGWPASNALNEEVNDFSFAADVIPYIEDGEILVALESGDESGYMAVDFIAGYSAAYQKTATGVETVRLNLNDIYQMAADKFKVDVVNIGLAEY